MSPPSPQSHSHLKRGAQASLAAAAAAAAPAAKIWRLTSASRACDGTRPGWTSAVCAQCGSTARATRLDVDDDEGAVYCEPCWAAYDAALRDEDPPAIRAAWLAAKVTNVPYMVTRMYLHMYLHMYLRVLAMLYSYVLSVHLSLSTG